MCLVDSGPLAAAHEARKSHHQIGGFEGQYSSRGSSWYCTMCVLPSLYGGVAHIFPWFSRDFPMVHVVIGDFPSGGSLGQALRFQPRWLRPTVLTFWALPFAHGARDLGTSAPGPEAGSDGHGRAMVCGMVYSFLMLAQQKWACHGLMVYTTHVCLSISFVAGEVNP